MSQHLISHFSLHYLSSGLLREVKNKEKFKLLVLKAVAVAYERWSLTRGSKYSDLTWKILVFWKTGRNRRFDCSTNLQRAKKIKCTSKINHSS